MKKLFFILSIFAVMSVAHAEDFPTQCQSGYTTVLERQIVLFDSFSCPSGYTKVNNRFTGSCLEDMNYCLMYIPSNTTYSDETGWFEYTSLCPLE